MPLVLGALLVTLVAFGIVADRALVGQATAAREVAAARAGETARTTAVAVRAALARQEQEVAAGRRAPGIALERVALPPGPALPVVPSPPYAGRPREELSSLLSSTRTTPGGLPEAVVARLALGQTSPVSGAEPAPDVEERFLRGELPVRADDVAPLARALRIETDPRVASLAERLRLVPPADAIPAVPAFRRRLTSAGTVEGWGRTASHALRYELPVGTLLQDAGAAGTAVLASAADRAALARGAEAPVRGLTHVVAVPEVDGFTLAVTPEIPGAVRVATLRVVLLLCLAAGAAGLLAARSALAKEAAATSRERAFLASVTHELRTPLSAMRLLGETLAQGRGDPRDYGALVAQESERLEGLVERVLAATRADEAPRFATVSPAELARSAVALVTSRAERRRVAVEFQAEEGLPEARWDGDAVRRALLNLLDNAVKHGREGGHIEVWARGSGGQVRLSVADDGPGIGRAHRDHIFQRFVRGRTDAPGTGLGLYLVEQVARAHGGRVDLVTEEARGSTFTLVLPLEPPAAKASP
jgi:signal transduction histidine kinase